jgi:hypothetical protein
MDSLMPTDALHQYFAGERSAGMLIAGLGVAALAFAWWLRSDGGPFRAMLFPLAIVGLLQLAIGVGLAGRTASQVTRLERSFASDASSARAGERERMARVQRNFVIIKVVETVLVVAGLAMVMLSRRDALVAVGMGLAIQGAVMLAFDVFAEGRGALYEAWLRAS